MEYRVCKDTMVLRLDKGDDVLSCIEKACTDEDIKAGYITGLGAVDHALVGVYKVSEKKYYPVEYNEEMEITSLVGNVSRMDGKTYLHLHANFAKEGGAVVGGHLTEARISVTAEIYIRKADLEVGRKRDESIGINMISF